VHTLKVGQDGPFTAITRVQIPSGTPINEKTYLKYTHSLRGAVKAIFWASSRGFSDRSISTTFAPPRVLQASPAFVAIGNGVRLKE
jgi:hypothetical protein